MGTVPPDPRPVVSTAGGAVVVGGRCVQCAYPLPDFIERCPECRGPVEEAAFGPGGTVFSATTVHVSLPGRAAPYLLAYVDLDAGPRILVHVDSGPDTTAAPGDRVALVGRTSEGDPLVRTVTPA
jgi:uncharacterized OB-fold protein